MVWKEKVSVKEVDIGLILDDQGINVGRELGLRSFQVETVRRG